MTLHLPRPHLAQQTVLRESRRFNAVACGRRWGKSTLGIDRIIRPALEGQPVAWFCPTYKNLTQTWREVLQVMRPVTARSDSAEHRLDLVTGGVLEMWSLESPDTVRGRKYARLVIDEAAQVVTLQDAWEQAIRSTLADLQGDAWFFSTPRGFNFFKTLFDQGQSAAFPDWASWQMPTHSNPHIPPSELAALEREMPPRVYRQEILALFEEDQAGALWKRDWIDARRVFDVPDLVRVVVAIDPTNTATGDEAGIVVAGMDAKGHGYILDDRSRQGSPREWGGAAIAAYHTHKADRIVAEVNNGGDMVEHTLRTVEGGAQVAYKTLHASRGKRTRAEPVASLYERGLVHHVGHYPALEDEYCTWEPGKDSPNHLDAAVWALTDLLLGAGNVEPLDASLAAALSGFTGY